MDMQINPPEFKDECIKNDLRAFVLFAHLALTEPVSFAAQIYRMSAKELEAYKKNAKLFFDWMDHGLLKYPEYKEILEKHADVLSKICCTGRKVVYNETRCCMDERQMGRELHEMNKSDLVNDVVEKAGLTKKDSEGAVTAIFDGIAEAMAKGDKVQLVGFGTFEVRERQAREGRNPSTGETIQIAAQKVPAFKPGKALKEQVK